MLLRPPLPAADVLDALYVADWQLDLMGKSAAAIAEASTDQNRADQNRADHRSSDAALSGAPPH